jgi:mannosyltransferase
MAARDTTATRFSREMAVLGAIVLGGALLRFTGLGAQGFWFDEWLTWAHSGKDFGTMLDGVFELEGLPPLYFAVAWLWVKVAGNSEEGLRALSAIAGTLTIAVVFMAVRSLATERAGLIAAALTATSPLLVWYSQEARPYALVVLFSALSFAFFARALSDPRPKDLAWWGVTSAVAIATHPFAAMLVAPEAAWLFYRRVEARRRVAIASAGIGVATLALAPLFVRQGPTVFWIDGLPFGERLWQVGETFALGLGYELPWVPTVLVLVGLAAVPLLLWRGSPGARGPAALAAGLALAGLALGVIAALLGKDYLISRYLLPLWVPACAAVAVAFGTRRAGIAAAALVCAGSLGFVLAYKTDTDLQRTDWQTGAAVLGDADAKRIIAVPSTRHGLPLLRYLDGAHRDFNRSARVSEVALLEYDRPDVGVLCWWGGNCTMPHDGTVDFVPPPGFRPGPISREGPFILQRFHAPRPAMVRFPKQRAIYIVQQ